LGPFRVGTFYRWDVLRLGTFCGLGRFGVGMLWGWDVLGLRTFCSWDLLGLGHFWPGTFCLGTFCRSTFVQHEGHSNLEQLEVELSLCRKWMVTAFVKICLVGVSISLGEKQFQSSRI
jgi:hypothetical protein